ncbi:MAG: hypothetical protein QOJ03_398 [Frankiaceae bacterium]|nr:hypothetical protein [Frankiaceae bacterium]
MTSYEVTVLSAAPPDKVFAVLADGAGWSRWAGPMVVRSWWEREGDPAPGGVGAIRALGLKQIGSREEIVAYDPPGHLAYTVLKGLPVRDYRADVHIEPAGTGSRIVWSGTFTPKLAGTGSALRLFLRTTIGGFARNLATYAERA